MVKRIEVMRRRGFDASYRLRSYRDGLSQDDDENVIKGMNQSNHRPVYVISVGYCDEPRYLRRGQQSREYDIFPLWARLAAVGNGIFELRLKLLYDLATMVRA